MPTRLGLQIPNFTYPGVEVADLFEVVAGAAVAGEASGFDTVFVMDHFFQLEMMGPPEMEMIEAYTLLGALAARTERVSLGTLVTGVTYRYPAVLAKQVTALDVISSGRALLGIGAAWYQEEHDALGVPFPPLRERFELLEDALRIAQAMFAEPQSTVKGTHHSITDAWNSPRPVRPDGIPIMIGGSGEKKTFRLAAQYADELNIVCEADELPRKVAALQGHLDDLGRDRSDINVTTLGLGLIEETHAKAEAVLFDMLRARGVDDPKALLEDPAGQALLGRFIWGDPEEVAARATSLIATGLDGLVINLPANGQDPAIVKLAGETLTAALDEALGAR
ncbi:LLM class F420-dependent oxidoreductase [soil metagenome]